MNATRSKAARPEQFRRGRPSVTTEAFDEIGRSLGADANASRVYEERDQHECDCDGIISPKLEKISG